jgi:hypothetical protein
MQRPASVTFFGILNIAFGALGIFGLLSTVQLLSGKSMGNNPVVKLMLENPTYVQWIKATIPINLITGIALVMAGIGLLRLKPWARNLSIYYAIFAILFCLATVWVNYNFLFRPLMEEAQRSKGPEAAAAIGGAIGGTLGGVVGMAYPIFLLVFMTRPKVVAAFQPTTPPPLPGAPSSS